MWVGSDAIGGRIGNALRCLCVRVGVGGRPASHVDSDWTGLDYCNSLETAPVVGGLELPANQI